MTPLIYNVALATGLAALVSGVFITFSLGTALMVGGGLVLGLTVLGAAFSRR